MNISTKLKLLKESDKWKNFDGWGFQLLERFAGSVTWDNIINPDELLYLISGKAVITLWDRKEEIIAPCKFEFPANTYHKIEAITDITLLLFL